jgi:hypothetical protein
VRRVLVAARRRYYRARPEERPALTDPWSYIVLFTQRDLVILAQGKCWPLPQQVLARLAEPPSVRARRRQRSVQRIQAVARRLLAADLPGALDAIRYMERRVSS